MHRHQSRQSQLLNISKWLRNTSNKGQCHRFLEEVKKELNHESIGSLIASLIIKNPSVLSNQNVNNLSIFCQSNQHSKPSKSSKIKCSLLSLSNDCFTHLASYLLRYGGISLGSCCHRLYQATQTISFVSNVGFGESWLTGHCIEKIYDLKSDPWMYFVNTKHLTLANIDSLHNKTIEISTKIMETSYYTNWFGNTMFCQLESLTISENGAQLLSCVPNWVNPVFESQTTNQYTGTMKRNWKDKPPLALIFQGGGHIQDNGQSLFFQDYQTYFNNNSNDKLDNIRKIWLLSCDETSFNELSESIGNILQPNYQCFRCLGSLTIDSLKDFCNLFHKNLSILEMEILQIREYRLMTEIYQKIAQHGYTFSLSNFMSSNECKDLAILTNDEIEFIHNNEDLMDKTNEIDDELASPNDHTDLNAFFQRIDAGNYIYNNGNTDQVRHQYHLYGNSHCLYRAYFVAICAWIDQKLTEISSKVAIASSDCFDSFIDNSCQKLILTKLNTEMETVSPTAILIHTVRQCARIESLHLRQSETVCTWTWHEFLNGINKCTRNPVLYKILNWKNSVKNLHIEFFPQPQGINDDYYYQHAKDPHDIGKNSLIEFGNVISNIFTRFNVIENAGIVMKFATAYKNGYKLENANEDQIGDNDDNDSNNNRPYHPQMFTIDDMIKTAERYIETYVNMVITGIEQNYDQLRQRKFWMGLDIFVGNMDIFDNDVSQAVTIGNYLIEKKLIDESIIDGTRFYIDNRQEIQHFGERVRKTGHHVKKLIKHGNIRKNLYRSFTNSFMVVQNA